MFFIYKNTWNEIDPGTGTGGIKVNVPLLFMFETRKREEVEEL